MFPLPPPPSGSWFGTTPRPPIRKTATLEARQSPFTLFPSNRIPPSPTGCSSTAPTPTPPLLPCTRTLSSSFPRSLVTRLLLDDLASFQELNHTLLTSFFRSYLSFLSVISSRHSRHLPPSLLPRLSRPFIPTLPNEVSDNASLLLLQRVVKVILPSHGNLIDSVLCRLRTHRRTRRRRRLLLHVRHTLRHVVAHADAIPPPHRLRTLFSSL